MFHQTSDNGRCGVSLAQPFQEFKTNLGLYVASPSASSLFFMSSRFSSRLSSRTPGIAIRTAFSFENDRVARFPRANAAHAGRSQVPFGNEVRSEWQRAVQGAGGDSVGIGEIPARDGPEAHQVKIGVLGDQRIEGPLD